MKEELFLFSGGLDSTVLLKFFLKDTNKKLRVVYNKLGYDNLAIDRLEEQNKAAENILNYFYKKYRSFEYS
jgi:tRNA(Ile)-lysidine synthase TilS/MesJ